MTNNERLTPKQAIEKIKPYCAYQERCHQEARDKLYSFGLNRSEVEEIITSLISENYLNEQRFATQFAGGKFRMKCWGKMKIKQELKRKNISDYCIKKALGEINEESYHDIFEKIALQKMQSLKSEKNIFVKKRKLRDFLLQKGFENDLVTDRVNELQAK